MIAVAIDAVRFGAVGLTFTQEGSSALFTLPAGTGRKVQSVRVAVSGGNLQFFPERSSLQRRVLLVLGIAP